MQQAGRALVLLIGEAPARLTVPSLTPPAKAPDRIVARRATNAVQVEWVASCPGMSRWIRPDNLRRKLIDRTKCWPSGGSVAGHEARPVISPQISSLKCTSREQRMNPTGRDVRKKIDERSAGRVCRFLPREKGMTTAKRTEEPRGSHPFQDSLAVG